MNILLLGSGGREHAFAKALSSSIGISKLYIAPGNAGTNECGQNIQLNPLDFDAVIKFCIDNDISLLIPGNEDPLVHGIVDFIEAKNIEFSTSIKVAGPNQYCAQLEGSKDFAKAFMIRHNIPTAAYKTFDHQNISESDDFFSQLKPPYVLKADGLAAGKGVIITYDLAEAQKILNEMILGGCLVRLLSQLSLKNFYRALKFQFLQLEMEIRIEF